ncbi:MAG: hypothetical protein ABH867_04790 [Patescibacteria group bacterium]|nr:hypothetical protein [Patescibacteria group bacterium]
MKPVKTLKRIIVSESRLKLLQIFFYSVDGMFYVRQLTRLTKEKLNSIRRELQNLKAAGILESEWRGNKLFYWINKKNPFYQEILAIIMKTKGLGGNLIKYRQKLGKIKFVIFSGRFITGFSSLGKKDLIDLLLVGKIVLPELGVLVREEEKVRSSEINYTVMNETDFAFRKKNRDPFLLQILLQPRIMIIGSEEEMVNF